MQVTPVFMKVNLKQDGGNGLAAVRQVAIKLIGRQ